jgi:predicted Zn-dependent protease
MGIASVRGQFLKSAVARLLAWRRRHPWQAIAGLILLAALLGWAGYRGSWYFVARAHYRAAQQALDRHEWSQARSQLQACLRTWPDKPAVHLLAARAARRLERLEEAKEHLDACERLQGGESRATEVERALLRVHRGDLAAVEGWLRTRVAEDDPDTVEILDILSTALILDYRAAEAHQCLDELLRRQPDNFDILLRHALTAQAQAWYSVAVESLQKAVDLRPEADGARLSLAQNLVTLGRYGDALPHLTSLRERQPDEPDVLLTLARCLAGQGQQNQAVELLDQLLARQPDNYAALGERGWLCVELDRPAEGESYLRRAQALAPPDQALLIRFSDCLRLLGKDEEARRYREEADRLRADTLQALSLTKRIREESPNDPDLCHELGCILLRLGKQSDALRFFQKALKANPNHRPTHESLTALYEGVGDFERAAYHRRQLGPKR